MDRKADLRFYNLTHQTCSVKSKNCIFVAGNFVCVKIGAASIQAYLVLQYVCTAQRNYVDKCEHYTYVWLLQNYMSDKQGKEYAKNC